VITKLAFQDTGKRHVPPDASRHGQMIGSSGLTGNRRSVPASGLQHRRLALRVIGLGGITDSTQVVSVAAHSGEAVAFYDAHRPVTRRTGEPPAVKLCPPPARNRRVIPEPRPPFIPLPAQCAEITSRVVREKFSRTRVTLSAKITQGKIQALFFLLSADTRLRPMLVQRRTSDEMLMADIFRFRGQHPFGVEKDNIARRSQVIAAGNSSRSGLVNPALNWPNVMTCPGGDIAASTPRQSIKIAAFRLSLRAASLTAPAARQQATTPESRACGSTVCVRGTTQR
jgi:hypothetical protein